jgi:hypothetical protein
MGTKRKPSLEDAGRRVFELTYIESGNLIPAWDNLTSEVKKRYIKLAIVIYQEVDKCL